MKLKHASVFSTPGVLIAEVRSTLSEADRVCGNVDYVNGGLSEDEKEEIEIKLDAAYEKAMVLMSSSGYRTCAIALSSNMCGLKRI